MNLSWRKLSHVDLLVHLKVRGLKMRGITGAVLLLAVIFGVQGVQGADPYKALSALRIDAKPAPDFSLPSVDGKKVSLSDYRGKVVLLGFFKTF